MIKNIAQHIQKYIKKRPYFSVFITVVIIVLGSLYCFESQPAFIPSKISQTSSEEKIWFYHSISPEIIDQNKLFIGTTNGQHQLYDIETKKMEGTLLNSTPLMLDQDAENVLAVRMGDGKLFSLEQIEQLIMTYLHSIYFKNEISFWLIPLNGDQPTQVGQIHEVPVWRLPNPYTASPDQRYLLVRFSQSRIWLVDIQEKTVRAIERANNQIGGWWSEKECLYVNEENDIIFYDVEKQRIVSSVVLGDLLTFIKRHDPNIEEIQWMILQPFWRGGNYVFYLTCYLKKTNASQKWLLRINRNNKSLKLVLRNFDNQIYGNIGSISDDENVMVYPGGIQSNVIHVKDLESKELNKIKIDVKLGENEFIAPFCYEEHIYYILKGVLWRMNRDGGNQDQVLPEKKYSGMPY